MLRPSIENQVVLVTGGAGFIGSHIVDACLRGGAKSVIIVDNLFLGNERNLRHALKTGRAIFYKDDIEIKTSLDYIFTNHTIDIVFNCATKALNYSFLNPENAFSTNVTGILNLLELQRVGKFKTLCHFSTSEVYGSAIYEPMDEAHPKNPLTTYAAGKAAADLAVESYVRMFGVDSFIIRPFNNYGPRQNHKGMMAGIIPLTVWRILNDIKPEIHGTGDQTRDFIHVSDTVSAVMELYVKMKPADAVNISTDNQISMNLLVTSICKIMGYDDEVIRKGGRKSDVECHNACNKKIHEMIDYQLTPFDKGLKSTIAWYKENI